ncbi:hypothetical protein WA026_007431 [Henosepilachna vigintioctopunctata]|uniref:Receptor expression-enhancing protein n=1 Tax=Henosepilachna vigintioctopunctata TaxID=420089 RepID=A0AAW1UUQ3_9CUCU
MISSILSRLVILIFGTLYPAYASYKAVKTKDVKEYVKWMMYWIVFAFFTSAETFTDVFLSWFPFYYEIKIVTVIWLLSPATKGSSILYRKFVHPMLSSKEQDIDEYISKAKEQSYKQVLDIGQKGVTVLMQTALKGGGGLVNQLRKSYSLSDLNEQPSEHGQEETDLVPTRLPKRRSPHRSSATSSIYFPEIDVRSQQVTHVQSIDDLSSGYSSGEALSLAQSIKIQGRAPISTGVSLTRSKSSRVTRSTTIPKRTSDGEVSDDDSDIYDTNIIFLNDQCQQLAKLQQKQSGSSSENEFYDSTDKLHDHLNVDVHNNYLGPDILTACRNIRNNDNPNSAMDPQLSKKINEFRKNVNRFNEMVNKERENVEMLEKSTSRGGKYNKKLAPKPPNDESNVDYGKDETSEGAVKGTLILKPGIIKTASASDPNNCKEIFLHSPKLRRRSKQYFTSQKIAFDACSKISLITEPAKRDFYGNLAVNSSQESAENISLHSRSDTNLSDISLATPQYNKDSISSKMSSKNRLRLHFIKSKSFHMGNK